MQDAIEHGGCEDCVSGECVVPTAERQVRRQDHRTLFVTFGDNLEEQVGLVTPEWQIADLVDDQ